ncbi:hypothetical protein ACQ4M3_20575 [Leptolyngbya sp. AN03gr2]
MQFPRFIQGTSLNQLCLLNECIRRVHEFVADIHPDILITQLVLIEAKDVSLWRTSIYSITSTELEKTLFNFGINLRSKHPNTKQVFLIVDNTTENDVDATITIAGATATKGICALMPVERSLEGEFLPSSQAPIILQSTDSKNSLVTLLTHFWKGFESPISLDSSSSFVGSSKR